MRKETTDAEIDELLTALYTAQEIAERIEVVVTWLETITEVEREADIRARKAIL